MISVKKSKSVKYNPFFKNLKFLVNLIVKSVESAKKRKMDLNEFEQYSYGGEKYIILSRYEHEKPTKLFNQDVLRWLLENKALSSHACKILLYVMSKVSEDVSSVELTVDDLVGKLGLPKGHYDKAIRELRSHNILVQKNRKHYWFNPNYFYRGDRIRHYQKADVKDVIQGRKKAKDFVFNYSDTVLKDRILVNAKISEEVDYYDAKDYLINSTTEFLGWENYIKEDDLSPYFKAGEKNTKVIEMINEIQNSVDANDPYI